MQNRMEAAVLDFIGTINTSASECNWEVSSVAFSYDVHKVQ